MLNTTILNSTYLRDNEILHPEDKPGCEIFGYCQDSQGIIFCQYCYRFQTDGELFLTTQPTLADCHKELDIYILATNMLRYKVFCKFYHGTVYRSDLIELLRYAGISEGILGVYSSIFTEEELEKFIILLSGVSHINMPSLSVLQKTDTYLEIVKHFGDGMSISDLSFRFKKSPQTIKSILKRYSK